MCHTELILLLSVLVDFDHGNKCNEQIRGFVKKSSALWVDERGQKASFEVLQDPSPSNLSHCDHIWESS